MTFDVLSLENKIYKHNVRSLKTHEKVINIAFIYLYYEAYVLFIDSKNYCSYFAILRFNLDTVVFKTFLLEVGYNVTPVNF